MELSDALRRRRMVRAFQPAPVPGDVLGRVLSAGLRIPSAGFTQGVELLVLQSEADRAAFWELETDPGWRAAHPHHEATRRAPVLVLPLTGPEPYTRRYSEPDKAGAGLERAEAWEVPFWWLDAGCSVMAMLLTAVDEGLGALFMGLFRSRAAVAEIFGVREGLEVAGALLLGWPAPDRPSPSLARGRRPMAQQVHSGRYGRPWSA